MNKIYKMVYLSLIKSVIENQLYWIINTSVESFGDFYSTYPHFHLHEQNMRKS